MNGKWIVLIGAGLILGWMPTCVPAQPDRLWFATGQPALEPFPGGRLKPIPLLPPDDYAEFATHLSDSETFIAIRELSDESRPLQGYGYNFVFAGKNRGFTVHGTPESGYVVYADLDADGSLSDEEPIELDSEEGRHTALLDIEAKGLADGEPVTYPVKARFVITRNSESEEGGLRQVVEKQTVRQGKLDIQGQPMAFALYGEAGIYDEPHLPVWFDLNGDGQDPDDRFSDELFRVRDGRVNIKDNTYEFEVDRLGRGLTLKPLDRDLPPRPSLDVGANAPGFKASDIDGNSQSLDRYEGRVVLLDFWAVWCGPCRTEAPKLAQVHRDYTDHGLAILGVTPDAEPDIREFEDEFGHDWPQISEKSGGPIHRQYRVVGYPAKYLIGRDGQVLCFTAGKGFWEECWPKAEERLSP